jgi:TPR repeat protein
MIPDRLLGQSNLGVFYEQGRGGLAKDDQKAVLLYQQAARGGDRCVAALASVLSRVVVSP